MRIVEELSGKKTTWRLPRLTFPDGRTHYHTGIAIKPREILPNRWGTYCRHVDEYIRNGIEITFCHTLS